MYAVVQQGINAMKDPNKAAEETLTELRRRFERYENVTYKTLRRFG